MKALFHPKRTNVGWPTPPGPLRSLSAPPDALAMAGRMEIEGKAVLEGKGRKSKREAAHLQNCAKVGARGIDKTFNIITSEHKRISSHSSNSRNK